jgi:hypothetical protein
MRRLARHLFTLSSAVSPLLCVAVSVLWVRSYSVDHLWHSPPSAHLFRPPVAFAAVSAPLPPDTRSAKTCRVHVVAERANIACDQR